MARQNSGKGFLSFVVPFASPQCYWGWAVACFGLTPGFCRGALLRLYMRRDER